jgi:hypothetical protein
MGSPPDNQLTYAVAVESSCSAEKDPEKGAVFRFASFFRFIINSASIRAPWETQRSPHEAKTVTLSK